MSELLIELFSEEMPPNLQISARAQFKKLLNEEISSLNLKYKNFEVYSTPTRLTVFISGLPNKIKILASEISQSVHALSLRLLSPEEETN